MLSQDDEMGYRPDSLLVVERSPGKRHLPGPSLPILGSQGSPTAQQPHAVPRQTAVPRGGAIAGLPAGASRPVATPRRRSGAPTSIPNFPSANDHRTPPTISSPIRSPGPSSPIQSPPTPNATSSPAPFKMPSTISLPSMRSGTPGSSASTPWQFLGATSGAPTPSLDGPGRSSPHLGGPFEQLNLNGSWSGGNLWAEGSTAASSLSDLPLATPSRSGSASSAGGMNAEMLAKYRNMAGRASVAGSAGVKTETGGQAMEGVEQTKPALPAALARRRGSIPKASLSLPTPAPHGVKSPSPLGGPSTAVDATGLHPLSAADAPKLASQSSTLVLDVRPPSAYLAGHLPTSHSIPIPSTLIRRPAFTVAKVLLMLSPEDRDAVQSWKSKTNIVLLDVDSTSAGAGSLLEGLASKFTREGFGGKMWFVKGGQTALESNNTEMVSTEPLETMDGMTSPGPSTLSPSGNFTAGGLGSFAFLHGSTGGGAPTSRNPTGGFPFTPGAAAKSNPFDSMSASSAATNRPLSLKGMMLGNVRDSQTSTSGASGSSGSYRPKLQPANPFFDNIRQNLELSHGGITERIPLQLPADARRRAHELPPWLCELVTLSEADGAEQLAQQFYTVERNEQKRLQALMDWHTEGSGAVLPGTTVDDLGKQGKATSWARQQKKDRADVERLEEWGKGHRGGPDWGAEGVEEYYPFSITAGVERGIKNRYKNIWPYDFSRVRLVTPCEDESDYINASYIQPRGTSKRYIATQGPLDATFRDFWTLIWEQDVRVIVMLTKQFEGGQVKCGNYWQDCHYGPLHLTLDRQVGGEDHGRPAQSAGFDFGAPPSPSQAPSSSTDDSTPNNIRRTFFLSNDNHPAEPPRKIVQLQCVSWPDFDVPTSPDVLLGLIADVGRARAEVSADARHSMNDAPVLIHCSAGIGRTGSFILVDAILDALARGRSVARKRDDEAVAMPRSTPIPSSAATPAGRSVANSRHASGSPRGAGQSGLSESGDSAMSRGHGGKAKSVSFASGDKIVLPGTTDDGGKGVRPTKASPPTMTGLGISTQSAIKSVSAPIKLSSQPQSQGLDWLPRDAQADASAPAGDGMEVDSPFEYPPSAGVGNTGEQNQSINQWLQYREEEASDSGTTGAGRRPSIASVYTSEEKLSSEKLSPVNEDPQPIATARDTERQPTPLAEMSNPVLDVLESMRVQRMSLVQSLRQFVFAYKVIIHQSFAMLDEENARDRQHHASFSSSMATGGEDDEGHVKRRASPTELAHDRPNLEIEERRPAVEGALGRKASVKRMKQEVGANGGGGSGSSK